MFLGTIDCVVRDLHLLPLGVSAERHSGVTLYQQLYDSLRSAVLDGRLEPGTRLPSTRAAALELGVARNTVIAVFEQLVAEGFLRSRVGDGTCVADFEPELLSRPVRKGPNSLRARREGVSRGTVSPLSVRGRAIVGVSRGAPGPVDGAFQPGLPDIAAFPHRTWARILARHARTPEHARLGYGDAAGDPRLRTAIAAYVTATRGVRCSPERVVPVAGAQAALDLCVRLLLDPGDSAWIEEPGYGGARAALLGAGARIEPIPVDAEGLDVAQGEARCPGARLVYITPSCQFPLGATLSLERRLRLLDWAERAGAFVIEDDYDSEYRYRGRPITALQGIDANGRVAYIGTFSKTMFPALRVGYVIAPESLAAAFAHAVRNTGQSVPQPVQGALAEFIDAGHYGRHVRRMWTLYARRRARGTRFGAIIRLLDEPRRTCRSALGLRGSFRGGTRAGSAETRPGHGAPVIHLRAVRTRTKQALLACGRCRRVRRWRAIHRPDPGEACSVRHASLVATAGQLGEVVARLMAGDDAIGVNPAAGHRVMAILRMISGLAGTPVEHEGILKPDPAAAGRHHC